MVSIRITQSVIIRMLCVSALVLLAFAHKPLNPAAPLLQMTAQSGTADEPVFIRYESLPDGSIISICISANSEDTQQKHTHHGNAGASDCEACRLSSGFVLPVPPASEGFVPHRLFAAASQLFAPDLPRQKVYPPSAPPHAPPTLS